MSFEVLKPFTFSADGFTAVKAEAGEAIDGIPADLVPGLIAEGYIRPAVSAAPNRRRQSGR